MTGPFLAPERDSETRVGRAKHSGTTHYTIPGRQGIVNATSALLQGRDYYVPFYLQSPAVIDQIACEVTTGASGNLRMGLYRANTDWQPVGAPLLDSGDIAITVAVKTYTPSTPLYLRRGRLLGVVNMDTASTLKSIRCGDPSGTTIIAAIGASPFLEYAYVSRTYAAFPTPGTAWDTTVAGSSSPFQHFLFLRLTAP